MTIDAPSDSHADCRLFFTVLRREECRAAEWKYLCSSFHGLKLISFARQANRPRLNRAWRHHWLCTMDCAHCGPRRTLGSISDSDLKDTIASMATILPRPRAHFGGHTEQPNRDSTTWPVALHSSSSALLLLVSLIRIFQLSARSS